MDIEGKSVIVTGAASGLGRATAEALLARGARVAMFDINPVAAQQTGSEHEYAKGFMVDVTSAESVQVAINATVESFGAVHACINCAGVGVARKTLDREHMAAPLEAFQQVLDINLMGTFNVARLAAQCMARNDPDIDGERGVIINTASAAAFDGQMGQAAYAASKGAIVSLSLPMARDLASLGVRVNAIAPGIMGTPMLPAMPEPLQQGLVGNIQFPKRMGKPAEFAGLCLHILENAFINGECIRLDGALRMSAR
jgi:NAD(P)-dependent dehydrogenase (short-subunit alcohol dehydrogenase family)